MWDFYPLLFVCGALGALVKDVVKDGCFEFPKVSEGKLYLGFVGGALVGGFVGVVVDHSYITALLGGYTGISVIENMIKKQ